MLAVELGQTGLDVLHNLFDIQLYLCIYYHFFFFILFYFIYFFYNDCGIKTVFHCREDGPCINLGSLSSRKIYKHLEVVLHDQRKLRKRAGIYCKQSVVAIVATQFNFFHSASHQVHVSGFIFVNLEFQIRDVGGDSEVWN